MEPGDPDGPTPLQTVPDRKAIRSLADSEATAGTVVWHREDLRIADNTALAAAASTRSADATGDADPTVLPLFVFDPAFFGDRGMACDARIDFLHDCLRDLDRQYRDVGAPGLTYAHGDPIEVLGRFVDAGWDVVANRSVTGRYGLRRASLSGGIDAARSIAAEHGIEASEREAEASGGAGGATADGRRRGRQTDLSAFDDDG
nr:deoxyribodipyrimidine photo-lyase [Halorubrum sp. Boch-26]